MTSSRAGIENVPVEIIKGTAQECRLVQMKSAEWSAEDEEILDAMIDMVSNSLYEPLCPREGMLAWLKAIHPQPRWKPSDEQMEWLKSAVCLSTDKPTIHGTIVSLYESLKRL